MPLVAIDLLFGVLVLAAGCALGWWMRSREISLRAPTDEVKQAREVLSRLHELAACVATDVGAHTHRVEAINEQLHNASATGHDAVVAAVSQLIEANTRMQGQLGSAEEKLKEQAAMVECQAVAARTDVLTNLANRRAFDEEMQKQLDRYERMGEPFSLVMFDVDHFKDFNDTYGHQAGDEVLRRMGELLRGAARVGDVVARYGGEEFTVILPRTAIVEAQSSADRVRKKIADQKFQYDGQDLHITASLGIAQVFQGENVAQLIGRADAALYASKEAGRNCVHWHDGTEVHKLLTKEESPASSPGASDGPPEPAPERPKAELLPPKPESRKQRRSAAEEGGLADGAGGKTLVGQISMSNRTEFCIMLNRRLAEWRRGGATPSVIMIGIDDFLKIEKEYGERVGRLMLKATAQFLHAAIRDMDMVAHYDTATFAVLFPGTWLANVIGIAERLREAIAKCCLPTERGPLKFTVSVGGAKAMEADDTKRLLERTQESLDSAYEASGNCSMFHNGAWSETVSAAMERAADKTRP